MHLKTLFTWYVLVFTITYNHSKYIVEDLDIIFNLLNLARRPYSEYKS